MPPGAIGDRQQQCSIPGSTESGKTGIQPLAPFDCTPITSADELLEKANVAEPEILKEKKKSPCFFMIKLHKFSENLTPSSSL